MTCHKDHGCDEDAGLTLIELIITVFVASVILGVVAAVFISTMQANAASRDRDLATGRAQAISTSLNSSIRNAADVRVDSLTGTGVVARAIVATSAGGWECRAWAIADLAKRNSSGTLIAGTDGKLELRYYSYAPLATGAGAPAPAVTWAVMADQVEQARNGATTLPYFTWTASASSRLAWNLTVSTAEQAQVSGGSTAAVSGSAVGRSYQDGAGRCW
jgi:Tfp pilus assembly protein PilV